MFRMFVNFIEIIMRCMYLFSTIMLFFSMFVDGFHMRSLKLCMMTSICISSFMCSYHLLQL